VADPDLELRSRGRGRGRGEGGALLALPAFLPSVISFFLNQNKIERNLTYTHHHIYNYI